MNYNTTLINHIGLFSMTKNIWKSVGQYNVAKFGEATLGLEMGMKIGLFGMLQIALPHSLTKHFNLILEAKCLQTTSYA